MHNSPRRAPGVRDLGIRATGISWRNSQHSQMICLSVPTMFSKSLLVLAAVSGCYAQQAASDLTISIDGITQSLTDLTVLVKAVSTIEEAQVCFPLREFPANKQQLTYVSKTATKKYNDVVGAETKLNNNNSQASPTTFTEAEQEQLCSSLKNVGATFSLPLRSHQVLTYHPSPSVNTYRSSTRSAPSSMPSLPAVKVQS